MAWIFCRVCPSKPFTVSLQNTVNPVPGWGAFNALVSITALDVTTVGYCPYRVQYCVYCNETFQNMKKTLGQKYSVIRFDEAIYSKTKEMQWRSEREFEHTVLRLGRFHTVLAFLAVLGRRFEDSGLEDILTESGVFGSYTVMRIMNGKSYNKGMWAFKLVY